MSPMDDDLALPHRPFFSCDEFGFSVIDATSLRELLPSSDIIPLLRLLVGPNNILETRPLKALQMNSGQVQVFCEEDVTVHLDFDAGSAQKVTQSGVSYYLGGLDEGNDGKGYIPAA